MGRWGSARCNITKEGDNVLGIIHQSICPSVGVFVCLLMGVPLVVATYFLSKVKHARFWWQ